MLDLEKLVNQKVEKYYWDEDLNCAITMLKILAEILNIDLSSQVIDAAIGMHGAGMFGAQCGLVEGSLMFIGILGKQKGLPEEDIVDICYNFAFEFERYFGSLSCRDLRPEGFKSDNPPHLCEELTKQAVFFSVKQISKMLENKGV